MSEIKYGVISDTHQIPLFVPLVLNFLRKEGIEKLIVNGDIGSNQEHMIFTLKCIANLGLESFVQPGSHEKIGDYEPVINHFSAKYGNIINVFKNRKIEFAGHHLVFMPGSDFVCGGEYVLDTANGASSGFYRTGNGEIRLTSINEISNLVSHPDKTLIICHVPRKFVSLENGVDVAEFGEATIDFVLQGNLVKRGSVFPIPVAYEIANLNYPIKIKKENRGNNDLRELYEKIGITKAVSGHFHESVHRATDNLGNPIPQNKFVTNLFWNASYLDGLRVGILTVKDSEVAYRNINLADYIRK